MMMRIIVIIVVIGKFNHNQTKTGIFCYDCDSDYTTVAIDLVIIVGTGPLFLMRSTLVLPPSSPGTFLLLQVRAFCE